MSLIAEAIRVRYGGREVLQGVDLAAEAGHVTAIVGPNGSGKSTLLGALTATLPHEGRVRLNGRDNASRRPAVDANVRSDNLLRLGEDRATGRENQAREKRK